MYSGTWVNGKIHGRGRLETAKFAYEGDWRDGKKHGRGTCAYHDNGDDYDGEWADDKWHGEGEWVLRGAGGAVHEKYVGTMEQGRMHGRGQYLYSDGSVFDGQWVDNRMHGGGVFTFANGNKYTGDFVDDAKEGAGVLQSDLPPASPHVFFSARRADGDDLAGTSTASATTASGAATRRTASAR